MWAQTQRRYPFHDDGLLCYLNKAIGGESIYSHCVLMEKGKEPGVSLDASYLRGQLLLPSMTMNASWTCPRVK